MSINEEHDAEKRIMDAAKTVFHKRGYFGTRMQDIADEAGINKAMLHYYFRSKDKLFESVFEEALTSVFGRILKSFNAEGTFEEKLNGFVESYIDLILKDPYIPAFVIHEINHNPEKIKYFISEKMGIDPGFLVDMINEEIKKGNLKKIDPLQIITTIISASIFPFIGKPILQHVFDLDDDSFTALMQERKKIIPEIILNGIKK